MENLVKKWEMQASHFADFHQWTEVDHENHKLSVNGGEFVDGSVAYEIGNYNTLMADCPVSSVQEIWRDKFRGVSRTV